MHEGRDIWQRTVRVAAWSLLGAGTLSLFVAAMNTGNSGTCDGVKVAYASGGNGTYVRPSDALRWLGFTSPASVQGKPLKELDLRALERRLEKDPWVADAELYIDRNRTLHVQIREREPVARIFTTEGLTFFIDSSMGMIPVNPSHTPRVTVFTSLPVNGRAWSRRDSLLMAEVRDIAQNIASDSILSALVEQVDSDPVKGFVLVPKMGEHAIFIGDGRDLSDKFRRLKIFYRQVLSRTGWSMYRELDLRFQGQIVALPTRPASATSVTSPTVTTSAPATLDAADNVATRVQAQPLKPEPVKSQENRPPADARKPKAVMPKKD